MAKKTKINHLGYWEIEPIVDTEEEKLELGDYLISYLYYPKDDGLTIEQELNEGEDTETHK